MSSSSKISGDRSNLLCYNQDVDKTVRKFTSQREKKADEYRYWQSRPAHERMGAVTELSLAAYHKSERRPIVPAGWQPGAS